MTVKDEEKNLVHIKMRVGNIEFEINCREDQVKEVVDKVLSSVSAYSTRQITMPEVDTKTSTARAETCRGVIERLWREGWFTAPRSLDDVHKEMTRLGYHYDRTAVAHVLLDLVRDGILTREGRVKRYVYVQKRPPPQ
jgi:sirohydrochlorin ferrochelatase